MDNVHVIKLSNLRGDFSKLFSVEKLQILQDQFTQMSGVASLILYPDGLPITQPSNFSKLCQLIRSTEKGAANCRKSDVAIGQVSLSRPIIQPCLSGGLWDAGASIHRGQTHVASWLIGQVFNEEQVLNLDRMMAYAQKIDADIEKFSYAISFATVMNQAKFEVLCHILFVFVRQLSSFISNEGELKVAEHQQQLDELFKKQPSFSKMQQIWNDMLLFQKQGDLCLCVA